MAELIEMLRSVSSSSDPDLDECREKLACTCPDCQCKNTWGNYECKCKGNQLYIRGEDVCIGERDTHTTYRHVPATATCKLALRASAI